MDKKAKVGDKIHIHFYAGHICDWNATVKKVGQNYVWAEIRDGYLLPCNEEEYTVTEKANERL